MYETTWSSDRMAIEKSHFFDQIGAALTSLWPVFEPCGSHHWRKVGTLATRQSAVFCGPLRSGREEVRMIRREASRSEQVRFAAAFFAVNVPAEKVPARQRTRTCLCSLPAGRLARGKRRGPTRQVHATPILATRYVVRSDGIQSASNRAALMAPEDQKSFYRGWMTATCAGCAS